jgi:hypothetical protein
MPGREGGGSGAVTIIPTDIKKKKHKHRRLTG